VKNENLQLFKMIIRL